LRAANEDFAMTIETLKSELIQSNEDADAAHSELEQLRLHAFDSEKQTNDEANERDLLLRELQEDLERVKMEREEWESEAMRERVRREEMQQIFGQMEMELATAKTERENLREERDREQESAANLHAVLEEFQAGTFLFFASVPRDCHLVTDSICYRHSERP
jgi:chromosome segregation ATPase